MSSPSAIFHAFIEIIEEEKAAAILSKNYVNNNFQPD